MVLMHKASQSRLNSQLLSVAPSSSDEISVTEQSQPLRCQQSGPHPAPVGFLHTVDTSVSTSPSLTLRITGEDHRPSRPPISRRLSKTMDISPFFLLERLDIFPLPLEVAP